MYSESENAKWMKNLDEKNWIPLASRDRLSVFRIMGICASMIAYQIAYSVEFAIGVPIMSRLGISPSLTGVVWATGPISGFVIQPIIGYYSDVLRFCWGRRRIFLIIGSFGVICGFFMLHYIEFVDFSKWTQKIKLMRTISFTMILFIINVSINVLQGPSRALIGDLVPKGQQVLANIIGSAMISFAAIVTNLVGGLQLSKRLGTGTNDEFLLFVTGGALVSLSVLITLICAPEEPLTEIPARENPFIEIFNAARKMPPAISSIANIYFFSWMAYFPFQVAITDYFGTDVFGGKSNPPDNKYNDGVAFGMLVIAASNCLVLLFGPAQNSIVNCLGMKSSYGLSQFIAAISLACLFFVKEKWTLLAILSPLGVSSLFFNSIPFAVICLTVPLEQMGVYMGVMNSYAVAGQQLSDLLLLSLLPSYVTKKGFIIGSGFVFAIISGLLCFKMVEPKESQRISVDSLLPKTIADPIR